MWQSTPSPTFLSLSKSRDSLLSLCRPNSINFPFLPDLSNGCLGWLISSPTPNLIKTFERSEELSRIFGATRARRPPCCVNYSTSHEAGWERGARSLLTWKLPVTTYNSPRHHSLLFQCLFGAQRDSDLSRDRKLFPLFSVCSELQPWGKNGVHNSRLVIEQWMSPVYFSESSLVLNSTPAKRPYFEAA